MLPNTYYYPSDKGVFTEIIYSISNQTDFCRRLLYRAACLPSEPPRQASEEAILLAAHSFAQRRYTDFALFGCDYRLGAGFIHYSSRLRERLTLSYNGRFDFSAMCKSTSAPAIFISSKISIRRTVVYGNAVFAAQQIAQREIVVVDAPVATWPVYHVADGKWGPPRACAWSGYRLLYEPKYLLYNCDRRTRKFLELYITSETCWADLLRRYALRVHFCSYNYLDYVDYRTKPDYSSYTANSEQFMHTTCFKHFRRLNCYSCYNSNNLQLSYPPGCPSYSGHAYHGALALFPVFALFNHACDANILHFYVGRSLVLLATREIEAGEQLFVSYFPGFEQDLCERIERAAAFGFKCCCYLCQQYKQGDDIAQCGAMPACKESSVHNEITAQTSVSTYSGNYLLTLQIADAKSRPIHYFPAMLRRLSEQVRARHLCGILTQDDALLQALLCYNLDYDLQTALRDDFKDFGNANYYNLDLYAYMDRTVKSCEFYAALGSSVHAYYRRLGYWLYGCREQVDACLVGAGGF